jgi:cyanophycin synthetase
MQLVRVWVLRGPNIWCRRPVLEVEVDLGALRSLSAAQVAAAGSRLASSLQAAPQHRPGVQARFLEPLAHGSHPAELLAQLTLHLQVQAGSPVVLALSQESIRDGLARAVCEFEEEALGLACLFSARQMCLAALGEQPVEAAGELDRLLELAYDARLGPSTGAIVQAAQQRGIPFRRLGSGSLVQLGQGVQQRRILTAETDQTSAIAETVAQDKQLTRMLLRAVGVPVPEGRAVSDAADAWEAAEELGLPVVVKPQYGNHGRGVATNLSTREQVEQAYAAAREEGSSILVEQYIPGVDYRLLVIGGKLVAASLREPAQVMGDGRSTITELIEEVNRDPRRSEGHATVLSKIRLDPIGLAVLAEQGYTPTSIPPAGVRVLIRRNGNLSTGGTATDVTDTVHPEVARHAVEAARVVGLDIAGVDVVACDISRPLPEQRGAIVEVNAGPGLRMHLEPSAGKPRPVGEAVISLLYPAGQNGRIPTVAITGVNGKTTTTRLLAHLLQASGRCVGMACTDGAYIDGRRIDARDCSGPRSARSIFLNPSVEAAILETARGGILREGLGFDFCDVAVVTNIGKGDHLGLRGIDTLEELARVKRTVVEAVAPGGSAVFNAEDPLVADMASACPGRVIYFACAASHPKLAAHRQAGGRAVFVHQGSACLAEGGQQEAVLALEDVPLTHGGRVRFQVENVLAALAAAWALGLPRDVIRAGLQSFTGDSSQSPGRYNVFRVGAATVLADYAHNPSALAALASSLEHFPQQRRCLVFSGCNRRDVDVIDMGEIAGNSFDRVILYGDRGNNDRSDGELNSLLRQGLSRGQRVAELVETASEAEAIETALRQMQPGELTVVGVESIEEALALIQQHLAARA